MPDLDPAEEWLTPEEAAAVLKCSRQHVVNLCRGGRLPCVDLGTKRHVYRIKRKNLEGVSPFQVPKPRARPTPPVSPYQPKIMRP